jgi:Ca-activated chloride channel family protein
MQQDYHGQQHQQGR